MLTINQPLDAELAYPFLQYDIHNLLFFDIETTGFSASASSLYMIGCAFFEHNHWQLTQWFADDYESEAAIIKSFFSLCKRFKVLVHYNGNGFDIPYLMAKVSAHNLPFSFDKLESFDLYRKIIPYKAMFSLPNLKQKTLETFFSLNRADPYNGGELIKVYSKYMIEKYMHRENPKTYLDALLLHNKNDLQGLITVCQILHYTDLFSETSTTYEKMESAGQHIRFYCKTSGYLPKRIRYTLCECSISAYGKQLCLTVPLKDAQMKHFLSPCKDYYYLPEEDTAIHKDVAVYVDKEHREKAKPHTCYMKKDGTFLPLLTESDSMPCFYEEYGSKKPYFLADEGFYTDSSKQSKYVNHILSHFCKN